MGYYGAETATAEATSSNLTKIVFTVFDSEAQKRLMLEVLKNHSVRSLSQISSPAYPNLNTPRSLTATSQPVPTHCHCNARSSISDRPHLFLRLAVVRIATLAAYGNWMELGTSRILCWTWMFDPFDSFDTLFAQICISLSVGFPKRMAPFAPHCTRLQVLHLQQPPQVSPSTLLRTLHLFLFGGEVGRCQRQLQLLSAPQNSSRSIKMSMAIR